MHIHKGTDKETYIREETDTQAYANTSNCHTHTDTQKRTHIKKTDVHL